MTEKNIESGIKEKILKQKTRKRASKQTEVPTREAHQKTINARQSNQCKATIDYG